MAFGGRFSRYFRITARKLRFYSKLRFLKWKITILMTNSVLNQATSGLQKHIAQYRELWHSIGAWNQLLWSWPIEFG